MNDLKIEGNLGKDPVEFNTGEQVPGLFCSVAVNNSGRSDVPTWVRCFAYADVATGMRAIALRKGNRVHLEGELRPDKDGNLFMKVRGGRRISK